MFLKIKISKKCTHRPSQQFPGQPRALLLVVASSVEGDPALHRQHRVLEVHLGAGDVHQEGGGVEQNGLNHSVPVKWGGSELQERGQGVEHLKKKFNTVKSCASSKCYTEINKQAPTFLLVVFFKNNQSHIHLLILKYFPTTRQNFCLLIFWIKILFQLKL